MTDAGVVYVEAMRAVRRAHVLGRRSNIFCHNTNIYRASTDISRPGNSRSN